MALFGKSLDPFGSVSIKTAGGVAMMLLSGLFFGSPVQAQTSSTDITPSGVSAPSTRVADGFSSFFQTDASYSSWRGSRGSNVFDPTPGKGSQFYLSAIYGLDYQMPDVYRFQFRAKSGYVHSNHGTAGQEASIDTAVDTQLTAAWTYLGNENYRTFAGVALNLPTGTTVLHGNQRLTRMDPDLVDIGSYGAGLNINPTVGVVFAVTENTAVSMGAGYSWQGSFNREGLDPTDPDILDPGIICAPCPVPTFNSTIRRIDPGDVFTANINTSSIFNNLSVKTSFAFTSETGVKEDGVTVGRKGAQYTGNIGATYRIDRLWTLLANISATYAQKNKIRDDVESLFTEPKNSNSPVLIGSFGPTYALNPTTTVGVNYSVLWRLDNYYDFTDDRFIPAKLKHSAGASISHMPTPGSLITLRGSYYWVELDDGPFLLPSSDCTIACAPRVNTPPHLSYTGFNVALSGRIQF